MVDARPILALYRKLLALYPRAFRDRLGDSMEQTFQDLWKEHRRTNRGMSGFVVWAFLETGLGVLQEHLRVLSRGDEMRALLRAVAAPALISLLLILPLMTMEVVNRREFNEGFPSVLFLVLWLNLFALVFILMPIVRSGWPGNRETLEAIPSRGSGLLARPRTAGMIGVALILAPGALPLLASTGLFSMDRLVNGPNPEVAYLPGLVLTLALVLLPIAGGRVAGEPIARTLRAGGSLFAHPILLIIVALLLSTFAYGLGTLIIDQWPCFIGVPVCD